MIELKSNEREGLLQMFIYGPTYDGDLVSKSARDELVNLKLAERGSGYNWLTRAGIQAAIERKFDYEKRKRQLKMKRLLAQHEERLEGEHDGQRIQ